MRNNSEFIEMSKDLENFLRGLINFYEDDYETYFRDGSFSVKMMRGKTPFMFISKVLVWMDDISTNESVYPAFSYEFARMVENAAVETSPEGEYFLVFSGWRYKGEILGY